MIIAITGSIVPITTFSSRTEVAPDFLACVRPGGGGYGSVPGVCYIKPAPGRWQF